MYVAALALGAFLLVAAVLAIVWDSKKEQRDIEKRISTFCRRD